ncbi:helix-turn-helix transcriptional regulator [Clostridiaceae bacterium NSJ-31]|uniref:Helix-turn-helix transcriptional regulator n=1 Tax=Ligaoa zhengdingensis TaxID=2763658 RepID=A0A926DZD5_9FIRM|nr:helix-turn-helix transcriptional regulator [Ligaoa zhengdingensis]MBC8546597.1 helix-turn-helix transcriptional regulator [Ligaoa zhengdingensis]
MIIYDPLWKTLKDKGITKYALIYKYGFSSNTIHRLRHNGGISTALINDLCLLLNCRVEDILLFVPEEKENQKE